MWLLLLELFIFINCCNCYIICNSTELFYLKLHPKIFWPDIELEDVGGFTHKGKFNVEYEASLNAMPDLPTWMNLRQPQNSPFAYLYGSPPNAGITLTDVIALNRTDFNTVKKLIEFKTVPKNRRARYEVQLKFFETNVEEMLSTGGHKDLIKIFQRTVWNPHLYNGNDDDVYITKLASAVDMGYRLPLSPKEKEGVIVHIGSYNPFSPDLLRIENEVKPLRSHSPCPKDFRKTSAHRHFSVRPYFKIDWCEFRLFSHDEQDLHLHYYNNRKKPSITPVVMDEDNFFQPPAAKSHTRYFLPDFIPCIVIPAIVIIILVIAQTYIMFCNRGGTEKRNNELPSVEMSEFKAVEQASNKLREMTVNRDKPMLALPAPSSNSSMYMNSRPKTHLLEPDDDKLKVPGSAMQLNPPKLGAGVRRPSSLRPGILYQGSSTPSSRRGSTFTH